MGAVGDELDSSVLLTALLLTVGLLLVMLPSPSPSDEAPPQAVSVAAAHIKHVKRINFFAHLYIYQHLRFDLGLQ